MNGPDHYRESERLLALATNRIPQTLSQTDADVLRHLGTARQGGMSVPALAHRLKQPISVTELRLVVLEQTHQVVRLEDGTYAVPEPGEAATSSPETSTSSTTDLLLAALTNAWLANCAATVAGLVDGQNGPGQYSEATAWAKAVV
ncbi:hypothetical protein ACFCV3_41810 [Kribbella sp. NPDC056345]|uniref:hypothetical protein n=1 Tax=Kribbella sp. NPDC056345 TaxID=3345789 RepID=UPI0035E0C1D6